MSDIVEELREAAATGHDSTGYVMETAATEIEWLRSALTDALKWIEEECQPGAIFSGMSQEESERGQRIVANARAALGRSKSD